MKLTGSYSALEKRLLDHLYDNPDHRGIEVTRASEREFDVHIEGEYASSVELGDFYRFGANLVLALIHSMNWPKWADLSNYPEMVREGDWSGIRDSSDEAKAAIFAEALKDFETMIPVGSFKGHPMNKGCRICTKAGALFGSAHTPGPPCLSCGARITYPDHGGWLCVCGSKSAYDHGF